MAEKPFEGGCLCGQLRYRFTPPLSNECFCHCRSCRLAAGATPVAWVTVEVERFEVVSGTLKRIGSSKNVERGFCGRCGTAITYANVKRPAELDVTLASLDDPRAIRPVRHIWISDGVDWAKPADGLPTHEKFR